MNKKCKFRKKDGGRCGADVQIGKDSCVFHDPTKIEDGHRARRAGGITRSHRAAVLPPEMPDPLAKSADVSSFFADTIDQVRRGQLDPRVANTVGYLASVLLRSLEQGAMEQRVLDLEAALGLIRISPTTEPEAQPREDDDGNNP